MIVGAFVVSILALLVAGASALYTRDQARATRDQVDLIRKEHDQREAQLKDEQRRRAQRIRLVRDRVDLLIFNESGGPIRDVNIGTTNEGGKHAFIENLAFLDVGNNVSIGLPGSHQPLQVSWTDDDGVVWRRTWVGQEFELERAQG